jgi:VanZ family protein
MAEDESGGVGSMRSASRRTRRCVPPIMPDGAQWRRFPCAGIGLAGAVLLISILTLYPFDWSFAGEQYAYLLAWHPKEKTRDVISNLLLFLPVGFFGFFALRERLGLMAVAVATVSIGLSLSSVIEILQAFDRTRDSSLNDILHNGIGTGFGVLVAYAFKPVLAIRRRRLRWRSGALGL